MDQKLKVLIDGRPSVIRNSTWIFIVKIISLIIGAVLFLGGFILLVSGLVSGTLMESIMPEQFVVEAKDSQAVWNVVSTVLGAVGVVLGMMLLFMFKLSKMVLKRNGFIFSLDMWRYDYEKEEQEKARAIEKARSGREENSD